MIAGRMLGAVERVGNKMPNPAVLFLLLCVLIVVLSQVLFWFGVKLTYETISPPPASTIGTYYHGSVEPTDVGPSSVLRTSSTRAWTSLAGASAATPMTFTSGA